MSQLCGNKPTIAMKLFSLPLPFLLIGLLMLLCLYLMAGHENVLLTELSKVLFVITSLFMLQLVSKPSILK